MTTPDDDFSKKMDNKINKYFGDLYNLSPKDSQSGINQVSNRKNISSKQVFKASKILR